MFVNLPDAAKIKHFIFKTNYLKHFLLIFIFLIHFIYCRSSDRSRPVTTNVRRYDTRTGRDLSLQILLIQIPTSIAF